MGAAAGDRPAGRRVAVTPSHCRRRGGASQHFAAFLWFFAVLVRGASAWCPARDDLVRAASGHTGPWIGMRVHAYPYAVLRTPGRDEKKPAQVVRGLESTEVVEETDVTILGLLRRTKRDLQSAAFGRQIVAFAQRFGPEHRRRAIQRMRTRCRWRQSAPPDRRTTRSRAHGGCS